MTPSVDDSLREVRRQRFLILFFVRRTYGRELRIPVCFVSELRTHECLHYDRRIYKTYYIIIIIRLYVLQVLYRAHTSHNMRVL